jgi:hypothetical protein
LDPLASRVARRFLADLIGNPVELLHKFETVLKGLAELEYGIPKMREAEKIIAADPDAKEKAYRSELGFDVHDENELVKFYYKNISIFRYKVKSGLASMQQYGGAGHLFLAILQQYELPPATRKTIENAARFFSKSRVHAPEYPVAIDAYERMLASFRMYALAAHDAIAHGKPHHAGPGGEAGPEKLRAGPFTLINTGGFDDSVIAECAKVVEQSAHLLQSKGLGKVCYGDVLISNTLARSNLLAFYMPEKDEMFVRANLKGKEHDAIRTVTHELGHRLQFKFLANKKREIDAIYDQIARKSEKSRSEFLDEVWKDPATKPKVGDTLVSRGKEYTVTGFTVSPRSGIVVLLIHKEPGSPTIESAKVGLEGYVALKGIAPKGSGAHHSAFVTSYAKKDADENFAEMVWAYCAGKLPPDQVEMLEALL